MLRDSRPKRVLTFAAPDSSTTREGRGETPTRFLLTSEEQCPVTFSTRPVTPTPPILVFSTNHAACPRVVVSRAERGTATCFRRGEGPEL